MANLVIIVSGGYSDSPRPDMYAVWDDSETVKKFVDRKTAVVKISLGATTALRDAALAKNGSKRKREEVQVPELSEDEDIQELTDKIAEWFDDLDNLPTPRGNVSTFDEDAVNIGGDNAEVDEVRRHKIGAPVIVIYAVYPDEDE